MKDAMFWLLSAGSLHFQQAEPVAGKGRRDFRHAGTGGGPDERHDAKAVYVFGNDIAAVHPSLRQGYNTKSACLG